LAGVLPEEIILQALERCLQLSQTIVPRLAHEGTSEVPREVLERYTALMQDLHREKRRESILSDESWEWIWDVKEKSNYLQLYGRLAWINYNLFDLL